MIGAQQLQAFQRTIASASSAIASQSAANLAQTAKNERARVIAEQSARAKIAPTDLIIADGVRNAPIDSAKNVVVIEYRYMREIVKEALDRLRIRSPVASGRYANSFEVSADGRQIEDWSRIPYEVAEVLIVNTTPYARRLEVGKKKDGTPFVVQVAPHIVESVALFMGLKWQQIAIIKHTYIDLAGAPVILSKISRRKKAARVRYPAMRISMR